MSNDVECSLCGCEYREHSRHECDVQAAHAHGADMAERETIEAIVAWLRTIDHRTIEDWGLNATGNIIGMLEDGSWDLPNGGDPHA